MKIGLTILNRLVANFLFGAMISLCNCCDIVVAQMPIIVVSDSFPTVANEFTWLFKQPDRLVYHYDLPGNWVQVLSFPVKRVTTCNAMVIIDFPGLTLYYDPAGEEMGSINPRNFLCKDSVCGEIGSVIQLFDNRPDKRGYSERRLTQFLYGNCGFRKPEMIQGREAYGLPQAIAFQSKMMMMECTDLRNWGMLGVNAQWLIEPKYDAPFHFKNGIAEVLYYGQKRKINEKGEFVE
jgi:hypothetical protein